MKTDITVIIPVYNEEDNLYRLRDTFKRYLPNASRSINVLFVNDGSTDKSIDIIKEVCANDICFSYIDLDKNRGLSTAIKAGFDYAQTPFIGYMDADLQTHPEDFEKLIPFIDNYALVTGVRQDRKDSFGKNISSKFANIIRRIFTKDGMDDTGCPLKIIRAEYAKKIPMFKGLHRFLPAMILLQEGTITQVPIRHFERIAGTAKFGFWNRLIGPFMDCFAYLWMKRNYINYQIDSKKDA